MKTHSKFIGLLLIMCGLILLVGGSVFGQQIDDKIAPKRVQEGLKEAEKKDVYEEKVVRSKVNKDTFYFVENPKYSKEQETQWKKECKRKYRIYAEYKECYQKLKKDYLEKIEN